MLKIQTNNKVFSRDRVEKRRKFSEIHYHSNYELYFLLEGDTKYFIGDEIFQLHKGNIIFIPKGILHKTDSETCLNVERLLLSFNDDLFDDTMLPILEELYNEKLICIPKSKLPLVEDIYRKIEKEDEKDSPFKEAMLKTYISELLILIMRLKTNEKLQIGQSDKFIYGISEYIYENFTYEISLKSLSRQFAFSESYLSKKFKAVMGMGINKYINYVRILHSEKLLKETDISIMDIAQKCGFTDSNYFSTVFKKSMGITPLKYRAISKEET